MNMHSDPLPSRVLFFQVRDPLLKLTKITEMAQAHFERRDPFIIFVEDQKAQEFVDLLLWKIPESSFLPHLATDNSASDLIVITKVKKNINQAKAAFNLCPTPLLIEGPFRIIYEFEDLTSASKKNLSSCRFDAYKESRCLIEAIPL